MIFRWHKQSEKPTIETLSEEEIGERVRSIRRGIKSLEDTIFGVALFLEGLSRLHAGEKAVIETHQKQFRNVIEADRDTIKQAKALLETVERDPSQALLLRQFSLVPCRGHSNPQGMERRAVVLVQTYNRLFPERSRERELTEEEIFHLMEEAAEAFAAPP